MNKPKLPKALLADLEAANVYLVQEGLADSAAYPRLRAFSGGKWEVAQSGPKATKMLSRVPYAQLYEEALAERNYWLRMLDGAIVQVSYEGKGESLRKHRIAYLPSPSLLPYQEEPDLYIGETHFLDVVGDQVAPVPLRFDYDASPGVSVDVVHPVSHVTLGQHKHCRIPVTRAVSPTEFIRFMVDNLYSTPETVRCQLKNSVKSLGESITAAERQSSHFAVP